MPSINRKQYSPAYSRYLSRIFSQRITRNCLKTRGDYHRRTEYRDFVCDSFEHPRNAPDFSDELKLSSESYGESRSFSAKIGLELILT